MTREETLTRFKSWCQNHIGNECSQDDYQMANNIIALLEQELYEDCVSRQAVLDALRTCFDTYCVYDENNGIDYIDYDEAVNEVLDLKPVTPKQKTLEWIPVKDPYTELPKENRLWVTRGDSGCRWVDTTYYDMTEWLDPIDDVVAYALYEEPAPPTPYKEGASE